mmetsp:Transcript_10447/g.15253  ORF Transcript_10447/g.15253 Transcript_10447/m.15253 type:complete len:86 (-) Transcript_10447:271-528(-)
MYSNVLYNLHAYTPSPPTLDTSAVPSTPVSPPPSTIPPNYPIPSGSDNTVCTMEHTMPADSIQSNRDRLQQKYRSHRGEIKIQEK